MKGNEHEAEQRGGEAQNALFRAIFEGASDAILVADDERRFVDANEAACELFGVPREALLGSTIEKFAAQEYDVGGVWAGFVVKNVLEGEFPLLRANGERRLVWFRAVTNVMPGIHVSILRDISQRDREEKFRELFLGTIGHDLRNPLSSMLTGSTLLLRQGTLTPEQSRTVTRIHSSGLRMGRMIAQLLDFTRARLGPGLPMDRVSADLRHVAERIIDEIKQARPNATVDFAATGNTVGEWDVERIEQVFSNLVGNALEHGDGTGVTVRMNGGANALHVRVHNMGEPISSGALPHVFDPFRQTEKRRNGRTEGLGLGLYISRQIVTEHGGTIALTSGAEEGTAFEIVLPYRPEPGKGLLEGSET